MQNGSVTAFSWYLLYIDQLTMPADCIWKSRSKRHSFLNVWRKKNETVIFPVIFQNILSRMTWNGNGTIDSLNFWEADKSGLLIGWTRRIPSPSNALHVRFVWLLPVCRMRYILLKNNFIKLLIQWVAMWYMYTVP